MIKRVAKETKTKFVKIHCAKCKNEQNVFGTVSTKVFCLVCNEILAEPTGGRSKIKAKHEILE
jgi:small subunit ribosomal protein S27e